MKSVRTSGVTLIEMMIVVAIVGLIAGITFPAVTSGIESIRLTSASDQVASFLNAALNRANRLEQAIMLVINPKDNVLSLYSTDPNFTRKLEMPTGVTISGEERKYLLIPAGTAPRITVELANRRGAKKSIRVDPITGVPLIEAVAAE